MLTKSSSASTTTARRPFSPGCGGVRDWSVSQNGASRWLRRPRAIRTSSSAVSSPTSSATDGTGSTSPKPVSTPPALAWVSAVSYAALESRTSVAPAVTDTCPCASTSAVRMRMGASSDGVPSGARPSRPSTDP